MTQEWTLARFAAALALAWLSCGDDGAGQDGAATFADAAAPGDAASGDAAVVDCSGDHRESADNSNDPFPFGNGSAEGTGLSLAAGGAGFTICGQIDPRQATEESADYDAFKFDVAGDEPIDLRVELVASPRSSDQLALQLFRIEDGSPVQVANVPFRGGYALIAGNLVETGRYWVGALGLLPPPDRPIGYAITVVENRLSCALPDRAPDYTEANDGPAFRGNDTVAVDHANPPALTATSSDGPEETNLLLEPDAVRVVAGVSALVGSDGDSYLDRDAYLLATGPRTTELELRLSWGDGDVDLDLYLFEAGNPLHDYSTALGISVGGNQDELLTLNVDPDRSYWLWVAAFDNTAQGSALDLPRPYDVTLCPREHTAARPQPE